MSHDDARSRGYRVHTQSSILCCVHVEVKGAEGRLAVDLSAVLVVAWRSDQVPSSTIVDGDDSS